MKRSFTLTSILSLATVVSIFYGCSKSAQVSPTPQETDNLSQTGKHVYGLLPTTPEEYNALPKYSEASLKSKFGDFKIGRAHV